MEKLAEASSKVGADGSGSLKMFVWVVLGGRRLTTQAWTCVVQYSFNFMVLDGWGRGAGGSVKEWG